MNSYGIGCLDSFRLVALGHLLIYFLGSDKLAVARLFHAPNDNVTDRRAGRYVRSYGIDVQVLQFLRQIVSDCLCPCVDCFLAVVPCAIGLRKALDEILNAVCIIEL